MADFNALTALINAYIKQNGVKAITGQILNGVLRGMVSALGKGYTVAGEASPTTDPGTMTGPVAYIAHTAGTYEHFGNLVVAQGEVAMLIYDEAVWRKDVLLSLSANATVDANVGTPEVTCTFVDGVLTFDFRNMKGNPGDAAGFGAVTATVDANVGTPGVSVQTSGPDTAKNITFAFRNLKGETGVTSCVVTVDNTTGTPSCAVSLVGQELHLDFSGLKGAQGNTGSSVDYPFEIVNNLTTNDATKALSAAMGVQLESEVSQLEAEVNEKADQAEVSQLQQKAIELSFTDELNNYGSVVVDETGAEYGYWAKSGGVPVKTSSNTFKSKVLYNVPANKISWEIPSEYAAVSECFAQSVANGQIVSMIDIAGVKDAGILPLRGDWGPLWNIYLNFLGAGFVDKYTLSAECGVDDMADKALRGNVNFINEGYLNPNNGAFVSNVYWRTTDFIPVVPGESITIQSNSYSSCLAAFYDKDKVFQSYLSQQNNQIESNTITVPDGAYFMRCASAKSSRGYLIFNDAPYNKLSELVNKEDAPIVIGDNAIKAKNIDPIGGAVTAAEATISTAITDKFYSEATSGYAISEVAYSNLGSMVIENIEVGKRYYLKIGQAPSVADYRNYFIFAKSATEAVITASEIQNYVRLIDNTEHIYLITIPAGCTRVYTAGYTATFNTFWVKDMETKALEWLKVDAGNIDEAVISGIINTVESKNVKFFDSINKPIVFSGKRLVAFGDSITWGVASPGLVSAGENRYISLFCAHTGATLVNYAKSGACITDGQNEIESIHTTLTTYTGNADIIWIAGGVNDWQTQAPIGSFSDSGTTTLYGALNAICAFIKTNYPNAVVIFVTPIPTTSTTTFGVDHPDNLSQYRKAIQEVAASNGFNVVDGSALGLPDTMSDFGNTMFAPTDCVHPTLAGHAMYARSLAGKLL